MSGTRLFECKKTLNPVKIASFRHRRHLSRLAKPSPPSHFRIVLIRDFVGNMIAETVWQRETTSAQRSNPSVRPVLYRHVGRRSYVHGLQDHSCGSDCVNTSSITIFNYELLVHMSLYEKGLCKSHESLRLRQSRRKG